MGALPCSSSSSSSSSSSVQRWSHGRSDPVLGLPPPVAFGSRFSPLPSESSSRCSRRRWRRYGGRIQSEGTWGGIQSQGAWGFPLPVAPPLMLGAAKPISKQVQIGSPRNRSFLCRASSASPSSLASGEFGPISEEAVSETKRLVETAMLAAATGLAYFLSNSFRIENYFGCFFPLPLVISSLRWGAAASRKTMVATAMLLLVLAGPIKAATYLLMHGFLGLTMGALWRLEITWAVSLMICTVVRSMGAVGFVLLSSWLLRENLLALITINAHASIAYLLSAMGINFVPSMGTIYVIFGSLVLLNCGSFVFLLHILYVIFQKRMGLESSLMIPRWLSKLCN